MITADQQDTWPPRVLVTKSGLTVGQSVQLYRVVNAQRTLVRAGDTIAPDTAVLRVDAELPFGVPVHYEADVNGAPAGSTTPVTYTLPGGKNAITDAVAGTAAEVEIQEWTTRRRERRHTRFVVNDGRNVVVSSPLGQRSSTLTLLTRTESSGDNLEGVLETATQGVIQIRQGSGATDIDAYLSVLSIEEERYDPTQGEDVKRLWHLDVVETEAWAPNLRASGFTWGDLRDAYAGLTWADLRDDYSTWLGVAQGEYL